MNPAPVPSPLPLPRPATAADIPAIARVHVESWRSTYRGLLPEGYLRGLDPDDEGRRWSRILAGMTRDQVLLLAEEEGRVVGFAFGGPDRDRIRDRRGELYAIYLVEEAQRRGWGAALLRSVATYLAARAMPSMVVWVLRDNSRARAFYERMGGVYLRQRILEFDGNSVPEVSYLWTETTDLSIRAPRAAG